MNAQHTPGRLKVGAPPPNGEQTIVAESGLMVAIATTGVGHPSEANARRFVAAWNACEANARRFVAAWNACEGLDIGEIEKWGLGAATGGAIYRLTQQRDELLAVVKDFHTWADNQSDAQSKGCHSTFDLLMLREQRDIASAAIAKAEGGAA